MTPDQEKAVADFAEWANRERSQGHTIAKLFDRLFEHEAEDAKQFRRINRRLDRGGFRDPMPSLDPDDSGSIDIRVLGTRARFAGKWPVRAAIVAIAVVCVGVTGALVGRALASQPAHALETSK